MESTSGELASPQWRDPCLVPDKNKTRHKCLMAEPPGETRTMRHKPPRIGNVRSSDRPRSPAYRLIRVWRGEHGRGPGDADGLPSVPAARVE